MLIEIPIHQSTLAILDTSFILLFYSNTVSFICQKLIPDRVEFLQTYVACIIIFCQLKASPFLKEFCVLLQAVESAVWFSPPSLASSNCFIIVSLLATHVLVIV